MKRIKLLLEFIKLKYRGYNKEERYFKYAIKGLINFEQYEKFIDKKVMKGGGGINMNKAQLNSLYGMQVSTISKMLLQLQFNVTSIGFYYWITAIQQYRKNYNTTIEKVYNDVAQIHNTTRTRVERAMRTAKATATEQIQKQFNYYNKLTNKTVLELLTRNALFIEKVDNHIPRID